MRIGNKQLFQLHAEFCKVLANPKRLMIIALLSKKDLSVGDIAKATETPLPAISQHLRVLRQHHIVNTKKEGQSVVYSIVDPSLMEACVKIRQILLKSMYQRGAIAKEIDPEGIVLDN